MTVSTNTPTDSQLGTTHRVAEWIKDVNSRDIPDRPLSWLDGRYHTAAHLAYLWMDEHGEEDKLSIQQMSAALTQIRENPDKYELSVEYDCINGVGRWQVFKGVFAEQ